MANALTDIATNNSTRCVSYHSRQPRPLHVAWCYIFAHMLVLIKNMNGIYLLNETGAKANYKSQRVAYKLDSSFISPSWSCDEL